FPIWIDKQSPVCTKCLLDSFVSRHGTAPSSPSTGQCTCTAWLPLLLLLLLLSLSLPPSLSLSLYSPPALPLSPVPLAPLPPPPPPLYLHLLHVRSLFKCMLNDHSEREYNVI